MAERDTTLSFVTKDKEAYKQAQEYFEKIEHVDHEALSASTDPSEALKKMVDHSRKYGEAKPPFMVMSEWQRGSDWLIGIGFEDGQHTQIFYGRGEKQDEARKEVFNKASEYLLKTPLSYHSHLHGAVAEAAAKAAEEAEEE